MEGERITAKSVRSAMRSTVVLVGVNGSKIIGCVQVELHGRAAHIGMLAVDPSLQTSGVGNFLLGQAEEFSASNLEAEEAVLIVIASRKELIEFYLRRGYSKSDKTLQYPVGTGVGEPSEKAMNLAVLKKSFNKAMHATSA